MLTSWRTALLRLPRLHQLPRRRPWFRTMLSTMGMVPGRTDLDLAARSADGIATALRTSG